MAAPELGVFFDTGFDAALEIVEAPGRGVRARAASPFPEAVDDLVLFLLGVDSRGPAMHRACESWEAFQQLDRGRKRELGSVLGWVESVADHAWLQRITTAFVELRNRVLRAALTAVEWEYRGLAAIADRPEAPSQVRVHLHLPAMERRQWSRRARDLPECAVEAGAGGAVVVRPLGEESASDYHLQNQVALALGACVPPEKPDYPARLSFSDERTLQRDQLALLVAPMLAAYGFSASNVAAVRSLPPDWRRVNVEFTSRISSQAARAWLETPRERSNPFNCLFGDIGQSVQRSLRAWMPYVRCSRDEIFASKDEAYALLVYRASKPFSYRGKPEFTYDAMNPVSVRKACRNARASLAGKLEAVWRFLTARGRDEDAAMFKLDDARRIATRVQCGNKSFLNLLTADFIAVERLRKLGAWCRGVQLNRSDPEAAAHHLFRAAAEVNRVFRTRFKRLALDEDLPNLGNLLLIEGTAVASQHFGQAAPIDMTVRLSNAEAGGVGRELVMRNTFRIGPAGVGIINHLP